jgi:hypothetical protein
VLDDPFVEALEARGQKRETFFLHELVDNGLRQLPPLRRERDHPVLGHAVVDGFERCGDDVDAQHHPGAAAVRLVVDLTRSQRRRLAIAEEAQVELRPEHRGDGTLLGEPRESVRNRSEDVELQGNFQQVSRPRRSRARQGLCPR